MRADTTGRRTHSARGPLWTRAPLGSGVELLGTDDSGLAAVYKPPAVLSHPNSDADRTRCVLHLPYDSASEAYVASAHERVHLLHRLDYHTSGVLLLTAENRVARVVRDLFRRREVEKTYVALVFGRPGRQADEWNDWLDVRRGPGRGRVRAHTSVRVLRQASGDSPLTLLELRPSTGRRHQLRIQCALRGLPIVGDSQHGDFRANRSFSKRHGESRLFLHASKVRLEYELEGAACDFEAAAATPGAFDAALRSARTRS